MHSWYTASGSSSSVSAMSKRALYSCRLTSLWSSFGVGIEAEVAREVPLDGGGMLDLLPLALLDDPVRCNGGWC